jgi:4-amino-4-deoxy-L-arabinose transferase-like glycosyltransferase
MAMLLSGFVCLVFLVIFLLSMQEKEGKVREKRFSLKKKKEGKKIEKSSEEVELRMYTLLFFLLGLFFIILGMVDFYTSPPDNLFRNLAYATIKIIVGGILWAITVFFSWAQNRRVGIFVCFSLGSCLLLIAIGEMCASPPPSPFYGPGRYIPYTISKFIMGIILWGFMLYLSWKTLKEKRIGKEKKIRAFSASRRLSTASRIFQ